MNRAACHYRLWMLVVLLCCNFQNTRLAKWLHTALIPLLKLISVRVFCFLQENVHFFKDTLILNFIIREGFPPNLREGTSLLNEVH